MVQADVDGELTPAEAARVAVHLDGCIGCTDIQARLLALSGCIRREALHHSAPDALHAAIRSRIADATPQSAPSAARPGMGEHPAFRWWRRLLRPTWGGIAPFGAGFALAACLALVIPPPRGDGLPGDVVAGHIRALQPGHLMDVASTDQHTVKPWFDGRLDFAPPVKDLKAEGYPLAGGRLDYLGGRTVAALVYQRRQHVIDLFVWPDGRRFDRSPVDRSSVDGDHSGYNVQRWNRDGMAFWAVSDLNAQELADFVRLWQAE
jgi:anti-sigma factor RsiW